MSLLRKNLRVAGSHRKSFGWFCWSTYSMYRQTSYHLLQLRNFWRGSKAGGSAPSCSLWFTGDVDFNLPPGCERQWNCWSCGICRTHIGLQPSLIFWLPQPYLFGGVKICQSLNCVRSHSWIPHPLAALASWWLPCITRLLLEIMALAIELWWSWSKLQELFLIGQIGQTFCIILHHFALGQTWTQKIKLGQFRSI